MAARSVASSLHLELEAGRDGNHLVDGSPSLYREYQLIPAGHELKHHPLVAIRLGMEARAYVGAVECRPEQPCQGQTAGPRTSMFVHPGTLNR